MDEQINTVLEFSKKTLEQVKDYFVNFDGIDVQKIYMISLNVNTAIHKIDCLRQLAKLQKNEMAECES
jgi:hypothetical protein